MSTITTRAGKGSPLTNNELDSNFTNLNADKVEIGGDLSGTPTSPIVTKVQGQNFSTDVPNVGEKLVWNGTAWEPATDPSGEPIGHEDKSQSSISFNTGTRTFTISPVSANFVVWCKGVKHTYTSAQTVVIPDTTGLHFIYFNASGVLSTQMSYFTWEEHAPTSYIYWNATTQQAVYFGDERHGITLDWQTHEYLHRTRGAAIASGFGASGYTTTGAGSTDADAQIDIGGGTFFDEDLQVDIVSTNTPVAGTWQQDLSGPARIPVLYLSGSAWVIDAPTDFPFKVVSGVPQYNSLSGSTWSTAPVTNNEYFVTWILATHNLTYPVISVIGQAQTNNISAAESMTFEGLTLPGFPSVEFRPLYKIIYQYKTSYANTVKVSTIAVYDLRSISSAGVAAALVQDHGNLSGLGDDDHAQYLHVSAVRSPSAAVTNSFLPSQASQSGKYLTTDGSNPSWGAIPSGSLTFTGDVTGTGNTGSSTTLTLANSGVTAGTFTKVTVDAKGRVTNGASASSSDITTALGFTPENVSNKAVANGYASLDSSGKVPSNQLPSYVDDVLEYANLAAFPGTGETGKIYIAIDTVKTYRWSGSAYVEITSSPGSTDAVPEGSTNLYFTNARARAAVSASGSLSYSTATGIFSYTQPTNVSTFTNDSGYLTGITGAQVTTALGYTPYNATNPAGYTTNVGTVTSVSGTGTVSGLTLTGSVTSSGSLTLGGTLSLTSGQVTSALGYTPYNATNPSGYITSSGSITGDSGSLGGFVRDRFVYGDANNLGSVNVYTPDGGIGANAIRRSMFYRANGEQYGVLGVHIQHANNPNYGMQIASSAYESGAELSFRTLSAGTWNASKVILSSSNYNDYAPSKTGTGASGTWGINVTGTAGSISGYNNPTTAATANTIVYRDGGGDIYGRYYFGVHFNQSSSNTENPSIAAFWTNSGSDNYNRKSSPAHVISQLGLLTTSNYSSYALPLSGGTVTGFLGVGGNPGSDDGGWGARLNVGGNPHARIDARCANDGIVTTVYSHQGQNRGYVGTMSNHRLALGVNGSEVQSVYSGYSESIGSYRAPIFYDSNNTGYYMDPSSSGNVQGNWEFSATDNSSTSYSVAAIELRESNKGGSSAYLAPRLAFHWGGVVASQISIDSGGAITIRNNPGTGYENLIGNILYGDASVRAPIFYDTNNTGYYLDPHSTSNIYSLTVNNTGDGGFQMGGSGNVSFYGNEINAGSGGGTGNLYIGYRRTNAVVLNSSGGYTESATSVRAPIFYDSNDTGYYVDPLSTTRLNTVTPNHVTRLSTDYSATSIYGVTLRGYSNQYLWLDGGTSTTTLLLTSSWDWDRQVGFHWTPASSGSNGGTLRIGQLSKNSASYNHTYTYMHMNGADRFYWDWDGIFMAYGQCRAPIFYDYNDTGYYCDPNSTSQFNQARFVNRIAVGNGSTPYLNTGTAGIWFSNSGGASHFAGSHDSDTSWWGVYTNSAWRSWLTGGGSWISTGDQRAPIFYDYNDTGYYCNPNDWSLLWGLSTYYIRNNYDVSADHPFGLYFNAGLSNAYAIYRESGPWTNPFPDLRIAFHTGIKIGANSGYQGVRFYTDYDMSSQVMSVNNGSDPLGGGNVYVNSALQAGGSLRAPIFYDSADTGYYLDHTSATSLRTVGDWRSDSGPWSGEFAGKIQYHSSIWYFQAATGWQFRNSVGSQLMYVDSSGNATFNGNVTAYSDRRLKDNVRDLTGAKAYLDKISAKRFTWKDDGYEDIGFIAQDVEAAGLTEFVLETADYDPNTETTSDPVKSLDYGRMVSVLWQAVKEQELQISSMLDEIKSLKERLH